MISDVMVLICTFKRCVSFNSAIEKRRGERMVANSWYLLRKKKKKKKTKQD